MFLLWEVNLAESAEGETQAILAHAPGISIVGISELELWRESLALLLLLVFSFSLLAMPCGLQDLRSLTRD